MVTLLGKVRAVWLAYFELASMFCGQNQCWLLWSWKNSYSCSYGSFYPTIEWECLLTT